MRRSKASATTSGQHGREAQVWGQGPFADLMTFLKARLLQAFGAHTHGVEWGMHGTLAMVRRRWPVVVGVAGFFVLMTVLLLIVAPREYTAKAQLQINTRQEQVTNFEDVVSGLTATDAAIRTELDVITSRKVALRVVRKLELTETPGFQSSGGLMGLISQVVKGALMPLSGQSEGEVTTVSANSNTESPDERRAVDTLLANLDVTMKPRSFTIDVAYTASTPELATKIANALGAEYLNNQLEERFEATKRANDWINTRLKQLQQNVQRAEMAVRTFREENNLTTAMGVTLNDQQLSELNSQLIIARTQLAEAEAKVAATSRGVGTTSEVLNNPLIQNLRMQETEVRRSMSDLASRYGPMHPRMQTVRNELADVQRKIGEEMGKIRGSLDNNIDMARARVKTLEEQLGDLQKQGVLTSGPAVQLGELERQAEAERSLYESFLARSRQIAQLDFVQADARIISSAIEPRKPSNPKPTLWLAAALVLGLGAGVALMLLLEMLDSGFRGTKQLEEELDLRALGLLGELGKEEDVPHFAVNKPRSAFAEAIRAVRTSLQFANPDKPVKVVLITSSVPQEGKSTFAVSLAQLTAHSGAKVLLVDADLRRPSQAHKLGLKPTAGLAELLTGQAKEKDVLLTETASKLKVIPALSGTQFAQELLSSAKMSECMAEWRKTYDLIVLDCPPVMAVADAVSLSRMADAVVFVTRWGTTPRVLAAHALKLLRNANAPVAGVVLSRVDLEKQKAYGYGDYGYYYGKYKEYYAD